MTKTNKSRESNNIEKNEFRTVIKSFYVKGDTPKEIKVELDEVYGTSASSFKTVYNWANEIIFGCTSTRDEPRLGRPVTVAMPEIIEDIHYMILKDRRVTVREIVEAIDISHGTVTTI